MAGGRQISIRLSLEDAEKVRAGLRGLGADGEEAFKALERSSARTSQGTEKVTNSLGLARYQVQNLTAQVVDFGVQIGSGQGFLMPMIQQGPQAVDALGGVSGAMRVLAQVATPMNVGIAATAAVLATAVLSAERADRAINDLSARLRTTRSDFQELARDADVLARKLAGSTTLSTSDARAAAGTIAGSRDFSGDRAELERLTKLSADVARAFGITVPEAAQRLADGLKKPGEAARRLINEDFRGVDDALRRQIELMEASGKKMEAQSLLADGYARGVAGAAAAMTPFQRSLESAAQAAAKLWNGDDGKSGLRVVLEGIGRPIVAGGGGLISFLASVIEKLETVRSKVEGLGWVGRLIAGDPMEAGAQANDFLRGRSAPSAAGSPVTGSSDVAARILYGEANGQGEQGLAAAAAVIVNRARLTGQTPDQVVQAPGQFEPWGNSATRDRLMAMSPGQYEQASRILAGVMGGQIADPTGGATHFYAPGLQASLGRNAPSWASGEGVRIGGHVFYSRPQDFGQGSAVPGQGGRTLAAADDGLRNWDNQDVLRERNAARINLYENAAATPGLSPERAKDYADRLKELRAEAEKLRDPMEDLRRQGDEQARVFRQASGAAQTLAEAELRGIQAARSAGEDVNGQAARGLEERTQAQARLRSELLKAIEATERDTGVKQAQVAVVASGARAMQDAAIQRQAEIEALNFAAAGTEDYTLAVNLLVDAKKNQKAADVNLGTGNLIAQQTDQIALLEREAQLIGLSTEARQAELAVMKERQRVQNAGGDPDSDISRQAQDNIRRTAQMQTANQQLTNSWNELSRIGEQAFDRIGSAITEAFVNGQGKAINFGNIAKAVFSEVVQAGLRLAVINPILNSVFGGTRGTAGGIMTVAGGGSGSQSSNGIGDAFSGSNIVSTAGTAYSAYGAVSGTGGASAATAGLGMTGSAVASGALYGAGGYYLGSTANSLAGGNAENGNIGAGIGATVGLVLGPVGALVGGILGGLVGGLFGPEATDGTGVYRLNLSNGAWSAGGSTGDKYSKENSEAAQRIALSAEEMARAIQSKAGVANIPFNFEVAVGSRDGLKASYGGTERRYEADDAGTAKLVSEMAAAIIESIKGQASTDVQSVISNSGSDVNTVLANLDFYNEQYRPVVASLSAEKVTSYAAGLQSLNDKFGPLISKAAELGLAVEPVSNALAKSVEALNSARVTQFDATISGMVSLADSLRGGNQLGGQLEAFDKQRTTDWEALVAQILDQGFDQNQVDDAWKAFGALKALQRQQLIDADQSAKVSSRNALLDQLEAANGTSDTEAGALAAFERNAQVKRLAAAKDGVTDMVLLEQTLAEQRLQIQRSYADQRLSQELQAMQVMQAQANQLSGFLDQMAVSGAGVSPQNSFFAAQSQFGAALEASRNSNDVSGAIAAGQTLLAANSAYNATGAEASAVRGWVESSLRGLGATLDLPGYSATWERGVDRLVASYREENTSLRGEVSEMRASFDRLSLRIEALAS